MMASKTNMTRLPSKPAPRYTIPNRAAVTVEHPCLVNNIDKGIEMLGGDSVISRSLAAGPDATLHLQFHPKDPASRPFVSFHRKTKNILLQVAVPRRTGRKRKRGSNDHFAEHFSDLPPPKDARYLLRSLQDNPKTYSIEPIATIPSTHVFRGMPDFVYSTADSPFLNEIRSKILPISYPLLQEYQLPQTQGLTDTEVIPPPQLSALTIPSSYSYRSNAAFTPQIDPTTGQLSLYAGKTSRKINMAFIQWHTDGVPSSPPDSLPSLSTQGPTFKSTVELLRGIFATRPIWTKRALINQLPRSTSLITARSALAHVAYTIRSGPWRDTVCLLGIDPRTDAKFRTYQSVMIQLVRKQNKADDLDADSGADDDDDENETGNPWDAHRAWRRSTDPRSHIFTGAGDVPPDGKVWQVCDILDPLLSSVTSNLPANVIELRCEARTRGFYPAGAWAKLKIALKIKVDAMRQGKAEDWAESIGNLLMMPDVWDGVGTEADAIPGRVNGAYLPSDLKGPELFWASRVRSLARMMLKDEARRKTGLNVVGLSPGGVASSTGVNGDGDGDEERRDNGDGETLLDADDDAETPEVEEEDEFEDRVEDDDELDLDDASQRLGNDSAAEEEDMSISD